MKGKTLLTVFIILAIATVGYRWLPPYYNPFMPLTLDDPPGRIAQYKLRRLTPEACASLLSQANQRDLIRTQPVADSGGACPLNNVVRVRDFGPVGLNSSFLASCPLALSSALFISQQARPLTKRYTGSDLERIDHLGSYACRNQGPADATTATSCTVSSLPDGLSVGACTIDTAVPPLIAAARPAGCGTMPGSGMFNAQAVLLAEYGA